MSLPFVVQAGRKTRTRESRLIALASLVEVSQAPLVRAGSRFPSYRCKHSSLFAFYLQFDTGPRSEKFEKHDKEKGDHESLVASTFQRMRHPSGRKHSSRPSTSDGIALREKERILERDPEPEKERNRPSPLLKEKSSKDTAVLRKRTSSTSDVTARSPALAAQAAGAPAIKPGRSVLEQIGTSDHNGWMRKKNDQFNSWRMRYFVLKGPHLYILKSNDKSVGVGMRRY